MAPRVAISESELLDALAAAGPKPAPPHAKTTEELSIALGISRTTTKKRLAQLRAEGRLEVWQAKRVDGIGRTMGVPAYTIIPAPRKRTR